MKSLVGAFAVLFLVTTFAVAQGYQPLPFPQAANTALASASAGEQSSSLTGGVPSSMAADQSQPMAMSHGANLGSPFPSAANPSLRAGASGQATPALEDQHDLGSPFPADANPSR